MMLNIYARSKYHIQLAKISFDEIFDLIDAVAVVVVVFNKYVNTTI